jgi:hypothetical protein
MRLEEFGKKEVDVKNIRKYCEQSKPDKYYTRREEG